MHTTNRQSEEERGLVAPVEVGERPLERLGDVVPTKTLEHTRQQLSALRGQLDGRTLWNVNSTARGGGVAEMLQSLLAYVRGAGMDAHWLTISGDAEFFRITKRLHNALHGARGDGSALGMRARRHYESILARNSAELDTLMHAGDVVLLHDPQTAGLIPDLTRKGCLVVWRCHIGVDMRNAETECGWSFLREYLEHAHAYVFTREAYVPDYLPLERCAIIAPSIDPLTAKNQPMSETQVLAILTHTGIIESTCDTSPREFLRTIGVPGRVERCADVLRLGRAPLTETPLIVQVSRWDRLKDPIGVLYGFELLVDRSVDHGAELVLAGPNVTAVADDPEGAAVYDEVVEAWRQLDHDVRRRVHLVNLPMHDVDENAAIVNALQRHAAIIVQKSLQEGFGLTVTEAMWKGRPLIASGVGGIRDQIVEGESGLLLPDPTDSAAFADCLERILTDQELAEKLGRNARQRALELFLCNRHLAQYRSLLVELDKGKQKNIAKGA
ncbi:MAG: glycosyltransferase [Planctomycetota bacterium]